MDFALAPPLANDYIQERLQYDNVFYIIDKEFWDRWNYYMNKLIKDYN